MSDTTHYCPQCVEFSAALLQAQAELVAAVGPSEVVVSRTDLEWALGMVEDEWTGTSGSLLHPSSQVVYDRLRAVLDKSNQSKE